MDITTLRIVSWDGHAINDQENFEASIPIEVSPLADMALESVERADAYPAFANKRLAGKLWTLNIVVNAGNISDLMKWFNPKDKTPRAFVVEDTVTETEWYVMAVTGNMPSFRVKKAVVQLYAADPVWRSVEEVEEVWNITASGQTLELTNSGNVDAYLKLDVKPTSQKSGWYYRHRFPVRAYHTNVTALKNRAIVAIVDTAALVSDATISNQVNFGAGYSAAALSIAIDTSVGGGLPTGGGMCYNVTTGEQIKYTSINAGVMTIPSGGRGWGGTTAQSIADNQVLRLSRCRVDGNDVRLFNQGIELERWLNDMNTSTTEVWSEGLDFEKDVTMTLSGSIASSGTVDEILVKDTATNRAKLALLPEGGGLVEVISGGVAEVFVYDGRDVDSLSISVTARQARGSSMALHSDGDTIRWRQFDLWIYCGYADATSAPEVDDVTKKPACDLSSSNGTLTFSEFGNVARTRPFSWQLQRIRSLSGKSKVYTGDHGAAEDPMTELGLKLACKQVNGIWQPEDGAVMARFYDPGGFTSKSGSGEKYRTGNDWAATAGFVKSKNGRNWVDVASISKPSAALAWQAWTLSSTAIGSSYKHVGMILEGSLRGRIANNENAVEANTMTLVLASPVVVEVGARQDMYSLDGEFEVQETGDALGLAWSMATGETLYMNSVTRKITHEDGTNAFRARKTNSRRLDWLAIPPGVSTLEFRETGAVGLQVTVHYEERNL